MQLVILHSLEMKRGFVKAPVWRKVSLKQGEEKYYFSALGQKSNTFRLAVTYFKREEKYLNHGKELMRDVVLLYFHIKFQTLSLKIELNNFVLCQLEKYILDKKGFQIYSSHFVPSHADSK